MQDKRQTVRGDAGAVQVVFRAAQLLNALEGHREGLSVAELAAAAQLPRPTVQRIALSLADTGLLTRVAGGKRFVLGSQLLRLALSVHVDVLALAQPLLNALSREVKETVNLLVREGRFAVCIAEARYEQELQFVPRLGSKLHLHASASGKALLAAMPEADAKRLLTGPLKRLTPATRTTWSAVVQELDAMRRRGVSVDVEESILGVAAISVPLGVNTGQVHALTVPMPVQRLAAKRALVESVLLRSRREWEAKLHQQHLDVPTRRHNGKTNGAR